MLDLPEKDLPPPLELGILTRRQVPLSQAAQHVASMVERICNRI